MEKVKRIVLIGLMFCVFYPIGALCEETSGDDTTDFDWAPVMEAIIEVESGGNSRAVSGNSVGAMQITPILVQECNQIMKRRKSKKRFRLADRFNVAKSKEMFLVFQSYFNPTNNVEKAIRMWNGGLHYSMKRTQRYFERVMSKMK
jgi:hypothetical protein